MVLGSHVGTMRGHTPEHYRQVAEVYDEAIDAQDPPTQSVAEAFDVPYTTAARWVRRARALGLLPPPRAGLPHGNRPHPEASD
ncbi:MAG: hypothetical protein QOK43_1581 [Acidimicrobiaceae bacterium]|jgi:transposase|nr:hypothetical protein [Acidimicrobiaceae bacterium]MDQ1444499.1 hypothetical protein [Acidimicrobiaceae bacterium]